MSEQEINKAQEEKIEIESRPNEADSINFPDKSEFVLKKHYTIEELRQIMAFLRSENGCPWDREQNHASLKRNLLEEAYEAIDAIDSGRPERLCDELGDVLMQVIFHAQIASENKQFSFDDVISAICYKLISRHTHIFADDQASDAKAVLETWEKNKKAEKGHRTQSQVLQDVPVSLPALHRSYKIQQKAAQAGFDWDDIEGPRLKIQEEFDEVEEARKNMLELAEADKKLGKEVQTRHAEQTDQDRNKLDPDTSKALSDAKLELTDEIGDLLFAVVNYARHVGVQPEIALNRTSERFIRRFSEVEALADHKGKALTDMTLTELDQLWDQVKIKEKQ